MQNPQEPRAIPERITHPIELDDWTPPPGQAHHDQFARFTHELAEDESEASARVLVRLVPLAYGVLLGTLGDRLVLGVTAGLALALAFDLFMGSKSLARQGYRQLLRRTLRRAVREQP